MERIHIISISLLFSTLAICIESAEISIPRFEKQLLGNLFPTIDDYSLPSLRKYRQELEIFREGVLEAYNKTLLTHDEKIRKLDRRIEKLRALGKLSIEEYLKYRNYVIDETKRMQPGGDLRITYKNNFVRYKRNADWVINEIKSKERERIRF